MNKNKWCMHRIGLINFWYYDEEEFHFLDGRMLLRGANGSGKSVTMQSFIPLLLDGNMRPERLDPFGSRARKMENYLLEEDDERDERTGYLYMELKRRETKQYMTIGIGMRGRRGKKLDVWYFCITDGRRIGKQIQLYKDLQMKIPYTKVELRNRIAEGGRVMDTQREYMECVNRLIFGFETIEEYKELLELLIQLRTPKLSKDFKPSVINDILSNSLQTLSEDDLRPMSEAIENMDAIKTNIDNLKKSIHAAAMIARSYEKYNERCLYDKACHLVQGQGELQKQLEAEKKIEQEYLGLKQNLEEEKQNYERLAQESKVLEEEKGSLEHNDAVHLAEQEVKLAEELRELKKQIEEKQKQEEQKKEKSIENESLKKKCQEENEVLWDKIEDCLAEMTDQIQDIPFDAHEFFCKELKASGDEKYSFDTHKQELLTYRKRIEDGVKILREEKREAERYNEYLQKQDEKKAERDAKERELLQNENLLREMKEEWLERLYQWRKENRELVLSEETMQKISLLVEQYHFGSDFSLISDCIRMEKNGVQDRLHEEWIRLENERKPKQELLAKNQEALEEWMSKKDPEPERSMECIENRRRLQEQKIPFYPFYQTVDFAEGLSEDQCGRIEEALEKMGILDALIISPEYREQVLQMDLGCCDRYLFGDIAHVGENIMEYLDVDNQENNIVFYSEISRILDGIGIRIQENTGNGEAQKSADKKIANDSVQGKETEKVSTWVDENGNYRIGILEGNVSGSSQAKYIGAAARERHREQIIAEYRSVIQSLEQEIAELEQKKELMMKRQELLQKEFEQIPSEDGICGTAKELFMIENSLEGIRRDLEGISQLLLEQHQKLESVRLRVQEICAKTYLTIRLEVFEQAEKDLWDYQQLLMEVEKDYTSLLAGKMMLSNYKEIAESLEQDLDTIRYERSRHDSQYRQTERELSSVKEQLALTDYEQIRERIDYCIRRLKELPRQKEHSTGEQSRLEEAIRNKEKQLERSGEQIGILKKEAEQLLLVFEKEWQLSYVPLELEKSLDVKKAAIKIKQLLEGRISSASLEDLNGKLQEVFHENKGYLHEYSLMMQTLFTDLYEECPDLSIKITRLNIRAKYRSASVDFLELLEKLRQDVEEQEHLLSDRDKELFEDILANTISKKIRAKIHGSKRWVKNMNELMESMQTSSGLRLSLKWKSKRAEKEEQLDTGELVSLLEQDSEIMQEKDVEKLSMHFRSKISEARKRLEDQGNVQSFHVIMREVLDYREWFEFRLESQKTGEKRKELTDRVFFTFSGGEKAMSMYVPLFSAVVAKYSGARAEAPRMISLDEAFAGVDEMNIKDMFRLMVEFEFNFMINSQILWGDYETVPAIAIYQLLRPENAKYVSVIPYVWNGKSRNMVERIEDQIEEQIEEQ